MIFCVQRSLIIPVWAQEVYRKHPVFLYNIHSRSKTRKESCRHGTTYR